MRRALRLVVVIGVLGLILFPVRAEQIKEIDWEALLPAEVTAIRQELQSLQVRLRTLSADERAAIPRVAAELSLRARIDRWQTPVDRLTAPERRILEEAPSVAYPEATAMWTEMSDAHRRLRDLDTVVNEDLDGSTVRLAGFLLPLEFDGDLVREFLLVPFVGACIHVPPPPPYQIVFVATSNGFMPDELYAPVTVSGVLSARSGQYDLFLEDGEAPIDVGYRIAAANVTPLEPERL